MKRLSEGRFCWHALREKRSRFRNQPQPRAPCHPEKEEEKEKKKGVKSRQNTESPSFSGGGSPGPIEYRAENSVYLLIGSRPNSSAPFSRKTPIVSCPSTLALTALHCRCRLGMTGLIPLRISSTHGRAQSSRVRRVRSLSHQVSGVTTRPCTTVTLAPYEVVGSGPASFAPSAR